MDSPQWPTSDERLLKKAGALWRLGNTMAVKDEVIKAMKEAGKPLSAGDVAKITGIDRKEVDKAFKELKAEKAIVSPVRCKWEPA